MYIDPSQDACEFVYIDPSKDACEFVYIDPSQDTYEFKTPVLWGYLHYLLYSMSITRQWIM